MDAATVSWPGAIVRNLLHVMNFWGREPRRTFWPYIAFWVIAQFLVGFGIQYMATLAMLESSHPYHPPFSPEAIAAQLSASAPLLILYAVEAALIAAALARRLHDRNMSAFWGIVPLFTLCVSVAMPIALIANLPQLIAFVAPIAAAIALWNLFFFVQVIALVVICSQRGTRGHNRYGDDPLA